MNGENEITKDYGCETFVQALAITGAVAIAACALSFVGNIGMSRSEIADCNKWAQQAEEYPSRLFFITQWQKDQCDAHKITINAHVK